MNNQMKTLIAMAKRKAKPGSGSQLKLGEINMEIKHFQFIKTDFMLVGGQALPLYMPKRYTEDWDILIRPQDAAKIQAEFKQQKATATGNLTIGGSSWNLENQDIDILECQYSWFDQAYQEAPIAWGVKVIPLQYFVLLKIQSARMQDLTDVSRMLGFAEQSAIAKVREIINLYAPNEIDDLESLIQLGKLEHQ